MNSGIDICNHLTLIDNDNYILYTITEKHYEPNPMSNYSKYEYFILI